MRWSDPRIFQNRVQILPGQQIAKTIRRPAQKEPGFFPVIAKKNLAIERRKDLIEIRAPSRSRAYAARERPLFRALAAAGTCLPPEMIPGHFGAVVISIKARFTN